MVCDCECVFETYMSVLVKKVQSIQIYSQDARGMDGCQARTLDVEEGRAEHGEGADQTWERRTQRVTTNLPEHFSQKLAFLKKGNLSAA